MIASITAPEIEAIISPYLGDHSTWNALNDKIIRGMAKRQQTIRTADIVRQDYEQKWTVLTPEVRMSQGKPIPCLWGERRVVLYNSVFKRIYLFHLFRLIETLRPATVLEVGSGTGLNLAILANRFPSVQFVGLELSWAGIEQGQQLIAAPLTQQAISFSPDRLGSTTAHQAVKFIQGNAAALPFHSASFDLALTVLALEQMEQIRREAISEIARVSRTVIMVEPFKDWNKSPLRRDYIQSQNYFSASVSDISAFGLTALYCNADFPSKTNLGIGVVAARSNWASHR